ncbi:MAG TPA: ion channel [Candidatus Saccharimonadales bacterium]|nr:ion channel [Candidatus Saccharimonadales bacterium]
MKRNANFEIFIVTVTSFSILLVLIQYFYNPIGEALVAIFLFDIAVSLILGIDLFLRARESKKPLKYLLKHVYEIPAIIPIYAIFVLDGETIFGAGLKSLRFIHIFKLIHTLSRIVIIFDEIKDRLVFIIFLSVSTVTAGALGVYVVERNAPNATITNLGDAFWWAIVTVTTVGYGDIYPVTFEGRMIAIVVMIVGVAILGILISTLGAQLIESKIKSQRRKEENNIKVLIKDKIDKLEGLQSEEIVKLLGLISDLHGELNRGDKGKQKSVTCSKCNNINPDNAIYCYRCGNTITNSNP